MYGWRSRIGLISAVNENVERSFYAYAPEGVSFTNARIAAAKGADLSALEENLLTEAKKFNGYSADILVTTLGDAAYRGGMAWEKELAAKMAEAAGVDVVTYGTAALEALQAVGAKKIVFMTPYAVENNDAIEKFFTENGVEVVSFLNIDLSYVVRNGRMLESADEFQMYRNALKADLDNADALFFDSMELASLEVINMIELNKEKPVISAPQALLWAALRHSGVGAKIEKLGKLFQF